MDDYRRMVREAINGELQAAMRYTRMAMDAPNEQVRFLMMSIAADEEGHARVWSSLLGLGTPQLDLSALTSKDFWEEVANSIQHELTDVATYSEIARIAPNNETRNLIVSIIADEFGHGRVFMAMQAVRTR